MLAIAVGVDDVVGEFVLPGEFAEPVGFVAPKFEVSDDDF